MIGFIKINLKHIGNLGVKIAGSLFSLLTLWLTFVSWDDMGITSKCSRLLILIAIILASAVIAVVSLFVKRSALVWEQGTGKIKAIYGDIIKICFPKKDKGEKIVVIPVNTCFDTIVGDGVVSAKTIHGQWIKNMNKHGVSTAKLDELIGQAIIEQGLQPTKVYTQKEKSKGKLVRFPIGTVLPIAGGNGLTYYLLALSEFDENLNAQCSKEDFVGCIQSLISFYDKNGQGNPAYLPLMGTGLSRVNISQSESLNIIVNMLRLNRDKIHGELDVVVYSKEKDMVSIHDV